MTLKAALDESKAATVDRLKKQEKKRHRRGGFSETEEFRAIVKPLLGPLSDHIRDELKKRPTDLTALLREAPPDQLAAAGLAALLPMILNDINEPDRAIDTGRAIQQELWAFDLLQGDLRRRIEIKERVKDPRKRRREISQNAQRYQDIMEVTNPHWLLQAAKRAGWREENWTRERALEAGIWFYDRCFAALPDVFGEDMTPYVFGEQETPSERRSIGILPAAWGRFEALFDRLALSNPVFVPSKSEPRPWTSWRTGGFWDEFTIPNAAFVRKAYHPETEKVFRAAFADGSMKQHIAGVNALQSVAWRINARVLEAVKRYGEGLIIKDLEASSKLKKSERKLRFAIKEEKKKFKKDIKAAERLKGAPFWLPMNCDYRGRVYPIPHLDFHRGDHIRALFLFDRGLPLGTDKAVDWLMDHAANCWAKNGTDQQAISLDKQKLEVRRQWARDNRDLIERTARLETEDWLEAKNPFQFLAACIELAAAWEQGLDYVTHLPIGFDCSNNGWQHLVEMVRAEKEAEHVNLNPIATCSDANDLYGKLIMRAVGELAARESAYQADGAYDRVALANLAGERSTPIVAKDSTPIELDRDLLKPVIVPIGYGSTEFSMKIQLREALADRGQEVTWEDLQSISNSVVAAIKFMMPKSYGVQKYLQEIARTLANKGKLLRWTTPTGFPLENRYHPTKKKQVRLLLKGVRVEYTLTDVKDGVETREAVNGACANVTHAMDAAHLIRIVTGCVAEGIVNIMTIHDCFLCLAPQAAGLDQIIRHQWWTMYEECDPLTEIRERAVAELSAKQASKLPPVPERGSHDPREVTKSVYFAR